METLEANGGTHTVPGTGFRHEAVLYAGDEDFVERTAAFVRDGLAGGEPALVVAGNPRLDMLRSELAGADGVHYEDMHHVGSNPARIIPVWQDFLDSHATGGRRVRGVGEPVYAGRGDDELFEYQRHELLLNLAFDDAPGFWLVCPYDTQTQSPAVVDEALRTHPHLYVDGVHHPSSAYAASATATPFERPLRELGGPAVEMPFGLDDLHSVRRAVHHQAAVWGLGPIRTADLVLAVAELTNNSIRHGGGGGTVLVWAGPERLICEIRDAGHIEEPLVGRRRPGPGQTGGLGLWLVNQLCDLVQIQSSPAGSRVRVHMSAA